MMKKETVVLFAFFALVIVGAGAYIVYEQNPQRGTAPQSQVGFSDTQQPIEEQGSEQPYQLETQQPTDTEEFQTTSDSSEESSFGSSIDPAGVIQYPEPVPPAERDNSEVAETLRNLRITNLALQGRVTQQSREIDMLRSRVARMSGAIEDLESEVSRQRQRNDRLQATISTPVPESQPTQQQEQGRAQSNISGVQLVRVAGDQAWLRTPEGRTYIVSQGDSWGGEYIIGIENDRVVTSNGVISQ